MDNKTYIEDCKADIEWAMTMGIDHSGFKRRLLSLVSWVKLSPAPASVMASSLFASDSAATPL